MSKDKSVSIKIAQALRHTPEAYGIELDSRGYTDTKSLIEGINNNTKYTLTMDQLKKIVEEDSKQRYSFNSDFTKIRANQGHSVKGINPDLKEALPPDVLYHGTGYSDGGRFERAADRS